LYKKLESVIIPFPNTSITAYKWLKRLGVRADFIYIDGSHEPEEVWLDLKNYFRLLTPGGVLAGDDYKWAGVQSAVQRFCRENRLPVSLIGNNEVYLLARE
jgi:predicted O-methyltransferase YrrM